MQNVVSALQIVSRASPELCMAHACWALVALVWLQHACSFTLASCRGRVPCPPHTFLVLPTLSLPHPYICRCTAALQYSSRPFIVGDRIQLKSLGGSVIVSGNLPGRANVASVLRGQF
jgi:hypothetical protein